MKMFNADSFMVAFGSDMKIDVQKEADSSENTFEGATMRHRQQRRHKVLRVRLQVLMLPQVVPLVQTLDRRLLGRMVRWNVLVCRDILFLLKFWAHSELRRVTSVSPCFTLFQTSHCDWTSVQIVMILLRIQEVRECCHPL
jgi:hypothetical protein